MRIATLAATMTIGLLLAASTVSFASPESPLKIDAIRSEQARIRAGIDARAGDFKELTTPERELVMAQQATVMGLIEGKQTADELDASQRRTLVAALASIDSVINKASDERMVCRMGKKIGSNMKERICLTVAQMRAQEQAARSQIDRHGIGSFIQPN